MPILQYQCTVCKTIHPSAAAASVCKEKCLAKGDTRNVVDMYKYWKDDAIRAALDKKRHNFSVLITNDFHDFNIGSVIRNANAFLAAKVYILGKKKFDPRGAVGTHHYENLVNIDSMDELPIGCFTVGFDDIPSAKPIEFYKWPDTQHVIMCFGQETVGLSKVVVDRCNAMVYITQYGSVRSLNVGVASGIGMYSYCSQIPRGK